MLTVNPIKFNNIKTITFGERELKNKKKNTEILFSQKPNANINFENDTIHRVECYQDLTGSKLGTKLRRTYNILFSPNCDRKALAKAQVMYMA